MASRKPNMLEAFQDSARAAQRAHVQERNAAAKGTPAEAPKPSVTGSNETGPNATGPTHASSGSTHGGAPATHGMEVFGDDVLGTRPRSARGIPAWMPVAVVVLLVAMAGTYWVTRELGREARADGGAGASIAEDVANDLRALSGEPESGVAPITAPPGNQRGSTGHDFTGNEGSASQEAAPVNSSLTADDQRFLDKNNRFTVRAIQYPNDTNGRSLAMQAYKHLRSAGLPAISPLEMNDIVVVCVGAEPGRAGRLAEIRTQLQGLAGPPPQNEPGAFSGAYDVNIKDYIDR